MRDIGRAEILDGLRSLAIPAGGRLLVHSSLSSIGWVDGGATTVIDALLHIVGTSGTVAAPTLTGSPDLNSRSHLVFDVDNTPGWTGAVAEALRLRPDAQRSQHPTHSVAAVGADATWLTAGHRDGVTPCAAQSPYGRLAATAAGHILLIGCDHESNTTLHHVEEIAGSRYHLQAEPLRAIIRHRGADTAHSFYPHQYGTPRRFSALEPFLIERGAQTTGVIGSATARLIRAAPMVRIAAELLRADPLFFVAK